MSRFTRVKSLISVRIVKNDSNWKKSVFGTRKLTKMKSWFILRNNFCNALWTEFPVKFLLTLWKTIKINEHYLAYCIWYSTILQYFLPHSHSWLCGYCFHPSWAGVWAGGRAAAATLSGLDLSDHKLEEVQTWHTGSYHGLVVQLDFVRARSL